MDQEMNHFRWTTRMQLKTEWEKIIYRTCIGQEIWYLWTKNVIWYIAPISFLSMCNSIRFFLLDFRDISLTYVYSGLRFFFSPETGSRSAEEQGYHANIPYPVERALCSIRIIWKCQISISRYARDTPGWEREAPFNISNISSQYSPFIPDPSLVWRVTGCLPCLPSLPRVNPI